MFLDLKLHFKGRALSWMYSSWRCCWRVHHENCHMCANSGWRPFGANLNTLNKSRGLNFALWGPKINELDMLITNL